MIVRDEAGTMMLPACLDSVKPHIDHWTIVDTGSMDDTPKLVRKLMKGVKGKLYEREFVDFGTNRTEAMALARGKTDWLLLLDADMTIGVHSGLWEWLDPDPDPAVRAWMVPITEGQMVWYMPLLVRGNDEWEFVGAYHEYLDTSRGKCRPLLGLTVTHHGIGRDDPAKFRRGLELLAPATVADDPRAIFYSAECHRFLGELDEAFELYLRRARMEDTFEEEGWYAQYRAALISGNLDDLIEAWKRRPHRHEPLSAAARMVGQQPHDDILFLELT